MYNWNMKKQCLHCGAIFEKRKNYSKNYWELAKYCSVRCGRKENNPVKIRPNTFNDNGEYITIYIFNKKGGHECLVDKQDYYEEGIGTHRWHYGKYPSRRKLKGNKWINTALHSLILPKKEGFVVDHINGNTLDNRRKNLRYLSHADNIRNQYPKNPTGVMGCRFINGKYHVRISVLGKEIRVGRYKNKQEALKARIEAEKIHWGHSFSEEKV